MEKLAMSLIHFDHLILGYENEKKERRYVLFDDEVNLIGEWEVTQEGDKKIPADLGAAMKLAKSRSLAAELQKRLTEINA